MSGVFHDVVATAVNSGHGESFNGPPSSIVTRCARWFPLQREASSDKSVPLLLSRSEDIPRTKQMWQRKKKSRVLPRSGACKKPRTHTLACETAILGIFDLVRLPIGAGAKYENHQL